MSTTRRQFMATGAGFALTGALAGCGALTRPPDSVCFKYSDIANPSTPLTIDAHAHLFNGSDIHVAELFKWVIVPEFPILGELGRILDWVAWRYAPTAFQEQRALHRLSGALSDCDFRRPEGAAGFIETDAVVLQAYTQDRDDQYRTGARQLKLGLQRYQRAQAAGIAPAEFALIDDGLTAQLIATLPDNYDAYLGQQQAREFSFAPSSDVTISGAIDFVLRNFQYRYVSLFDYLQLYSRGPDRKIDLVVAHLLDFDWPIGRGQATYSTVRQQIGVMRDISKLTQGVMHFFAPYDPMKRVAFLQGLTEEDPLDTVRWATDQGAIGVKMYLPMGFAPRGNAAVQASWPDYWVRPWIPQTLSSVPRLGEKLDQALADLYGLCLALDLPIMAHTFPSMDPRSAGSGTDDERQFRYLTNPNYWCDAEKHEGVPPGLRVDFGHFGGGASGSSADPSWANKLASLMSGPTRRGEFFYADVGDDSRAATDPSHYTDGLKRLYQAHAHDPALAERLMYGSDWYMLERAGGGAASSYLTSYEDIFRQLDTEVHVGVGERLSDRFFGRNAARYLGLYRTAANRTRLDTFHGTNQPNWMAKTDQVYGVVPA